MVFRKDSTAVTLRAVPSTWKEMLAHDLPPEPWELERSSTRESQVPMEAGAVMTTSSDVGFKGASKYTVDAGIFFQLEQSTISKHAAFRCPGSKEIGLPGSKVEADEG